MRTRAGALLALLLAAACGPAAPAATPAPTPVVRVDAPLVPVTRIEDPQLDECSGLVKLGGAWWTVEDSGAGPDLWRSETLDFVRPESMRVPEVTNVDWEELTAWDGDLLVADLGDNLRKRTDVAMLRVRVEANRLRLSATYPVRWPDTPRDCEAVFVIDGKAHAITKDRGDGSRVYRFDALKEAKDLGSERNVPVEIGRLELGDQEQVTGAAYDAQARSVVVLTYTQIASYPLDRLSGAPAVSTWIGARQAEAIAIDGDDLVFCNEQRDVFRIEKFRDWRYERLLPPRGKTTLGRDLSEIPLKSAVPGETANFWLVPDGVHLRVRLKVEGDPKPFDEQNGKPGTGFIACFAQSPARYVRPEDALIAVTADGKGGAAVHRAVFHGKRTIVPVSGATASLRREGGFIVLEATIPELTIAATPIPAHSLFDLYAFDVGRDDGPRHSGPDLFAIFRPYLWGDCERK